jgi:RimJ/RimL family protein N-acetyltransferase
MIATDNIRSKSHRACLHVESGVTGGRTTTRAVSVEPRDHLRTDRLIIRPWRRTDCPAFVRVIRMGRERLLRTAGFMREGENEHTLFLRQLDLCRRGDASCTAWRRLAFLDDGRLVGGLNVLRITRGLIFEAECTWWVAPDLEGHGLATEGVLAMIDHAMADLPRGLGLHTLTAFVQKDNAASARVAQKVGMERASREPVWLDVAGSSHPHETWRLTVKPTA